MNKRDRAILDDLKRFRVMSRTDISDLYFSHLKYPITGANTVLKRLVRDGQIDVSRSFTPYVYFPHGSTIKKNSTKIPHFLKIVEVYKQLKQYDEVSLFQVEPKFKKGLAEPDVYTKIKGVPFFIEIQRNMYSQKVMDQKIKRYEDLFYSGEVETKDILFVIMVTDTRYEINSDVITVFQVPSVQHFINNTMQNRQVKKDPEKRSGIIYKIG